MGLTGDWLRVKFKGLGFKGYLEAESRQNDSPKHLNSTKDHYFTYFWGSGRVYVGYCPPPVTVYIRVLLRFIYTHIIDIIQLVLGGGSTQGLWLSC